MFVTGRRRDANHFGIPFPRRALGVIWSKSPVVEKSDRRRIFNTRRAAALRSHGDKFRGAFDGEARRAFAASGARNERR